jgi:hypothetical protein
MGFEAAPIAPLDANEQVIILPRCRLVSGAMERGGQVDGTTQSHVGRRMLGRALGDGHYQLWLP